MSVFFYLFFSLRTPFLLEPSVAIILVCSIVIVWNLQVNDGFSHWTQDSFFFPKTVSRPICTHTLTPQFDHLDHSPITTKFTLSWLLCLFRTLYRCPAAHVSFYNLNYTFFTRTEKMHDDLRHDKFIVFPEILTESQHVLALIYLTISHVPSPRSNLHRIIFWLQLPLVTKLRTWWKALRCARSILEH